MMCAAKGYAMFIFSFARPRRRRSGSVRLPLILAATAVPALAGQTEPSLCARPNFFSVVDDTAVLPALCPVEHGRALVDATYFQNASAVGGTALAAFPLVRLRAGIADRLEAFIDTPSSVAESLLGGAELNPTTHLGYGLVYLLHANRRSELSGDIAAVPQLSQFATSGGQEKYRLDLSSGYLAMPRITLRAAVGVETRHDAGFGTVQPRSILGTDITPTRSTRLALDVGTHLGSRSGVAQSFGDAALIWRAQRSVSLAVGLGTTFNASGGTKPHYFSTGVTLRP